MKIFNNNDVLWYEKEIKIPKKWKGKYILLNFGAVDWKCELYYSQYLNLKLINYIHLIY